MDRLPRRSFNLSVLGSFASSLFRSKEPENPSNPSLTRPLEHASSPQGVATGANPQTDVDTLIAELVIANRIVGHLGIVDSFGHISVRNPVNAQRYFMSRSRAPDLVTKDDILEFDLESMPVDDLHGRRPYTERPIHGCIYQARPDVMAVCHNHAHELLPLTLTKTPIRPAIHTAAVIGHEVPVWDIRDEFGDTTMLVTNNDMGHSLARTLGKGAAALMRGHGSVVAGSSIQWIVFTAYYLHLNADVIIKARAMGGQITYLSPGEIDRAAEYHTHPAALERPWEEWAVQAGFPELRSK